MKTTSHLMVAMLLSSCAAVAVRNAPATGPDIVHSVLTHLVTSREFPTSETTVARWLGAERKRATAVAQYGGYDLEWRDAAGECFIIFAVDAPTKSIRHLWAKCGVGTRAEAVTLLREWRRDVVSIVTGTGEIPDADERYGTVFGHIRDDVAIDYSVEPAGTGWRVGIGVRNRVSPYHD